MRLAWDCIIHIPFCKAKCIYCDFYSLPHSEEKMDAYTAALQRASDPLGGSGERPYR